MALPKSDEICADLQRFAEQDCCDVCRDQHDELVYCSSCEVAVHSWCYGGRLAYAIPEDDWHCDRCHYGAQVASAPPDRPAWGCVLCPRRSGALKMTTDSRWAHVQCALWVPEAFFRYPSRSDLIDVLQIPAYRFDLECVFCRTTEGACFSCSDSTCRNPFHVPCAMANGIQFEYKQNKGSGLVFAYCCIERLNSGASPSSKLSRK